MSKGRSREKLILWCVCVKRLRREMLEKRETLFRKLFSYSFFSLGKTFGKSISLFSLISLYSGFCI